MNRIRIRYIGTADKDVRLEAVVKSLIDKWENEGYEKAVAWLIGMYKKFYFIDDILTEEKNKAIVIRVGKSMYRIEEQKISHKH
jgi:hypothetical protein